MAGTEDQGDLFDALPSRRVLSPARWGAGRAKLHSKRHGRHSMRAIPDVSTLKIPRTATKQDLPIVSYKTTPDDQVRKCSARISGFINFMFSPTTRNNKLDLFHLAMARCPPLQLRPTLHHHSSSPLYPNPLCFIFRICLEIKLAVARCSRPRRRCAALPTQSPRNQS